MLLGVAAVLAADAELEVRLLGGRLSTPIRTSAPTPGTSIVSNGLRSMIAARCTRPRNFASTSSREKPSAVCVRSLVPKLKKSACAAIRSAIMHARGSSIIVPTE